MNGTTMPSPTDDPFRWPAEMGLTLEQIEGDVWSEPDGILRRCLRIISARKAFMRESAFY